MKNKIVLLSVLSIVICGYAKSADWKYIGNMSYRGIDYYRYYDEETKEQKPNGNIVVWIKIVSVKQINNIVLNNRDSVNILGAEKLIHKYYPPYAFLRSDTPFDEMYAYILLEVAVNKFNTKKKLMMHHEFDCKHRKEKTLSATMYNENGEYESSSSKKREWEDIAPESGGETMLKVLCSKY
jgi:hypothetical protein